MKVRDLRKALAGVDDDMEVLLRVMHDEGDSLAIGDALSARVDAGCTDIEVFMIDGDEELDVLIPHLSLVKP